jgi:hypothetical protein
MRLSQRWSIVPRLLRNGVDECKTRKGIAAYSFSGRLDSNWSPTYAGKYSLVWALHVDGARLHTGGEFLTVNGVTQNYYARLSPDSIKGDDRANTLQAPLMMTLSTATVALTASTQGAATTPCALAGARTKDAGGVATTMSGR